MFLNTLQKQPYLRIPCLFSKVDWMYEVNETLIMLPTFLINWSLFWCKYFVKSQWELFMH